MIAFFGVVGAVVVLIAAAKVAATVADVVDDWRNGWARWKSSRSSQ
jgi:hypothetical protein